MSIEDFRGFDFEAYDATYRREQIARLASLATEADIGTGILDERVAELTGEAETLLVDTKKVNNQGQD